MAIVTRTNRRPPSQDDLSHLERSMSTPWSRFSRHLAAITIGVVLLYPLLWLVSSSVKPDNLIFKDLSLWPSKFDLSHYGAGWNALEYPFGNYIINSLIIVTLCVIGNVVTCSMAAYAFSRLRFSGRKLFFALTMGTLMLPQHVLLVPQYIMFHKLGWVNTYFPLVVPSFLATNAFFIFLMVQFMRALPNELTEAARLDGCGPFRIFTRIIAPLCTPAFATTAIFTFVSVWNEFFSPLLYLTDPKLYTVPLALRQFMNAEGHSSWGQIFAMSVISLAPVIGFFIAGQKYLVKGIATSGLKG